MIFDHKPGQKEILTRLSELLSEEDMTDKRLVKAMSKEFKGILLQVFS